jgi:two-component system chemotaxis response regulator CheB
MPIRLMIVDDSAFMRKIIGDAASQVEGVQVVGIARNGLDAIEALPRLKPDIITLDIEMPKLNGIETLKIIKKEFGIPVVMLSAYSKAGSDITMEALNLGALDFIEKTNDMGSAAIEHLKNELEIKLKAAKASKSGPREKDHVARQPIVEPVPKTEDEKRVWDWKNVEAIAIGASTGGPKILFEIISRLPRSLDVPVFIVQHMPKGFTSSFAERLNNECQLEVVEAKDNMLIQRGVVYVAPGDWHMTIENNKIRLDDRPKFHGVRPAVDYMFETAALRYGKNILGIILTGMGKDGTIGMTKIHKSGGYNLAQDAKSCVVNGMPGSARAAGVVDEVLTPEKIVENIKNIVRVKRWN